MNYTQQIRYVRGIYLSEPLITPDTKEAHRTLTIKTDGGDIDLMLITNSLTADNLILE